MTRSKKGTLKQVHFFRYSHEPDFAVVANERADAERDGERKYILKEIHFSPTVQLLTTEGNLEALRPG